MPEPHHDTSKASDKAPNLTLDDKNKRVTKTRTELYREMEARQGNLSKDLYEFATPVRRSIALGIDLLFMLFIIKLVLKFSPLEFKLIQSLMNAQKLEFMFNQSFMMKLIMGANFFLALFCLVIIPVAFYNTCLGKTITGLRVRGDEVYTISITKAFQRELIFKPLSMAFIVGFILPFYDKSRKSLHDKLAGTIVIRD